MAKMFYTMDETKSALGKSEDDIKQLSREGKLREFRDGPRIMFKADQVEALKSDGSAAAAAGAAADQVGLSAGDTHSGLGLMDSKTGSGSGTAAALKAGSEGLKEDTGSGMDVGLSGSLSGSLGGGSLAGTAGGPGAAKGSGKPGVNVFEGGEGEADPMAQTHITSPKDQISLEGVGSGSGLLDLTRETDDTSLGAALLDEISPGGKRLSPTPGAAPAGSGSSAGMTAISPMELPSEPAMGEQMPMAGTPVYVEAPDATAPAFAAVSIGGSLAVLVAIAVLVNAVRNDNPLLDTRYDFVRAAAQNWYWVPVIFFVVAVVLFVAGIIASKMNRSGTTA